MDIWSMIGGGATGNNYQKENSGPIGSLGEISFEVSSMNNIFTFSDYTRNIAIKSVDHDIIGGKPLTEITGMALQKISMTVKVNERWGKSPKEVLDQLIEYCENGEVLSFMLNENPVGDNKWIIESVSEKVNYWSPNGRPISSDIGLSLKEYIENEVVESEEN